MKETLNQPGWQPTLPSYRRALDIIRPHLDADRTLVRRLRAKQRVFAEMSPELLKSECPNLTPGDVEFLLDKFCRNAK